MEWPVLRCTMFRVHFCEQSWLKTLSLCFLCNIDRIMLLEIFWLSVNQYTRFTDICTWQNNISPVGYSYCYHAPTVHTPLPSFYTL